MTPRASEVLPVLTIVSRRFRGLCLGLCFFCMQHTVALAASLAGAPAMNETAAREQVERRSVGHRVKLVRTDGSEIRGTIVAVHPQSVDLLLKGVVTPVAVNYDTLAAVRGPGLSRGAKIGIGVGVGVLVAAGIFAIIVKHELDKPWNFNVPAGPL